MKRRQRSSRRVLRHFLQLAAVTFAINANAVPPARMDRDDVPRSTRQPELKTRESGAGERSERPRYLHAFVLPDHAPGTLNHAELASVRILDASGRKLVHLALHGAGMVGPLDHGPYTVLLRISGLTEVHRLRIGADTLPYLSFGDTA